MEVIEHVVYINLAHRTDRKEHIEKQLECFGEKVQRFDAIRDVSGIVGCGKSHIAVLKMAKARGWANVLVIEDDFAWRKTDKGMATLSEFVRKPFDVILFAGTYVQGLQPNGRLSACQTTTAYLINGHYYDTLIACWEEALPKLIETHKPPLYALDIYWHSLMRKDQWFLVTPGLCYQYPNHSDIRHTYMDYVRRFK